MNRIRQTIIGAVALTFATAVHSIAIEGLRISVQSSNVVLSWPSTNTEAYLVQYRSTLTPDSSWQTLTDYLAAAADTNITVFVHSNIVQYPSASPGGTNGGNISPLPPDGMSASSMLISSTMIAPDAPMAMPANGSGSAVPLALYPPGFDLSGFLIYDPSTGESVSGNGYLVNSVSPMNTQAGGMQPLDASGDTNVTTGFYRVVRDGAHLIGITNGMTLSGIITISIEVANGFGNLSTVSLTENDSPVGNSIQNAPFNLPLALTVDTTQMSNGVHQICASARWDVFGSSTNEESGGDPAEADSPSISVTISNEISFPNWMPEFGELGNSLFIRATSVHTNVDWYIDVYDSQYSYIGTFGGHTDDGDISVAWNLVGPDGVEHTNDNFFIFYITTPFSDPPTSPIYKHWEQWSGHGAWVAVAQHAWDNYLNSDLLYAELSGFIGGAKGVGWQVSPPASQDDYGNWDAYALHYGASDPQGDSDWQAFRNALYDPLSRNLVYFGHGGPDGLGYNPANTNRYIPATEIANMLHTMPYGQTNRHSFRFVFLDGCSTAKGTLPEAFGMSHHENVPGSDYGLASMRYSAFVGWPNDKMIGAGINNGNVDTFHVNFIGHIQEDMLLNNASIKDAIKYAAGRPDVGGEFNPDSMKVYGFWGLTFGLDN